MKKPSCYPSFPPFSIKHAGYLGWLWLWLALLLGPSLTLAATCGVTWTPQTSGLTSASLHGIAWSGSQFVAVGYDYSTSSAAILTSPNGSTWTRQTSGLGRYTSSTASPGRAASSWPWAVTNSGNPAILTSDKTGTTWTPQSSSVQGNLYGIAWSGSQFVAVGMTRTAHDPHQLRWDRPGKPHISCSMNGVLNGIAWSGSQFVAVGQDYSTGSGVILISPNGSNWTTSDLQPAGHFTTSPGRAASSWPWADISSGFPGIVTSPSGDELGAPPRTSGLTGVYELNGIAWSGSQFVAVGHNNTWFRRDPHQRLRVGRRLGAGRPALDHDRLAGRADHGQGDRSVWGFDGNLRHRLGGLVARRRRGQEHQVA